MAKILDTLKSLKLVSDETIEVFSNSTRDVKDLKVYKDKNSGVIFIDDFFVGDDEYSKGHYREEGGSAPDISYEDIQDAKRREKDFIKYYSNKTICDFGCGQGTFLKNTKNQTHRSYGIELQQNYIDELNSIGIGCFKDVNDLPNEIDSFFMFHSLEHLEDPIKYLKLIRSRLTKNGNLIIEVPHANDFLINKLKLEKFIDFTLWSQHLILHTKDTLKAFLVESGYNNIQIYGIQRFSLANHIQWLREGTPGGHRGPLAELETDDLKNAYQHSLDLINSTDTLIAVANK